MVEAAILENNSAIDVVKFHVSKKCMTLKEALDEAIRMAIDRDELILLEYGEIKKLIQPDAIRSFLLLPEALEEVEKDQKRDPSEDHIATLREKG